MAIITAFANSPDRGRGMARDMTARWALAEVGETYDVRLLSFAELKRPDHLAVQPFGQIPTFEDGAIALFESGAILLHIASTRPGLLPSEEDRRARAISWIFAAQATVEPLITEFETARFLEQDRPWFAERNAMVEARIRTRLEQFAARLGTADWLDGAFHAGDLMMIQVLRRLAGAVLFTEFDTLQAYVERGMARPAFERAFAAQAQIFAQMMSNTGGTAQI